MRCIRCMQQIEQDTKVCPFCGFAQDTPQEHPDALVPGRDLRNRFEVGTELGRGGFGITYIGYDKYLDCKVAIKEFFPQALAARLPGEVKLFWRSNQARDTGCQNVIREAQKMHKLGAIPIAVHVLDVFYENNTVYIAMDYVEGITLKKYLMKNGVLTPKKCLELMMPILDTMIQMHKAGIIHRDISPDNIMIQPDNLTPRILDLGAAKDIQIESGNTIMVARNGFSPMEQYRTNGDVGTWTDVYALCATMYYSLTGKVPPAAMDRSEDNDDFVFNSAGNLPETLCKVIQDGMRMRVDMRIQDMPELKRRLEESIALPSERQQKKQDDAAEHTPEIAVDRVVLTAASPAEIKEKKTKGLLGALSTMFGRNGMLLPKGIAKHAKTGPINITISQPDAVPMYLDPDATIGITSGDEEETVLLGAEQSVRANAVLIQNASGKRIEITKCCFVLGRFVSAAVAGTPIADCLIRDNTKHISRRHAAIIFNGESFFLQDISGKNTTLLNGVRIQNGIMPEDGMTFPSAYRLYDGDCIQLVDEKLEFHTGGGI